MIIWLLPLLAVALTSIRSGADLNSGNYWGMPTSINFAANYTAVFTDSPLGYYILNSFKITIPTEGGAK
jgi:multiple sugar transport system permease protein